MLKILFKHPLLNIIIILLITLFSIYGITKLKTSNDIVDLVPKTNKVYISDKKIKEIYNTGEVMIVGIKSKQGNILTIENLQTIDKMTKAIEDIELQKKESKQEKKEITETNNDNEIDLTNLLENIEEDNIGLEDETIKIENKQVFDSVDSITNIEQIEGIDGGLAPVKLEKYIPTDENELKIFKEKLMSWDLFQETIYSKDFSASSIMITFPGDSDEDDQIAAYKEVEKVVNKLKNDDMEIFFAGKPIVKSDAINYMKRDLVTLIPIVILVVLFVLLFSLKSMRNVLLTLLTVCIATIWVIGLMGIVGLKLTMIGTILPVILIAVGTAYGIHVLTHYMEDKNKIKKDLTKDENKALILETVKKVTQPVFLTALTTFFGFLSLLSVNIIPIKEFGVMTGIGVIIEFILSLIFIPSVIILLGPKKAKQNSTTNKKEELLPVEKVLIRLVRSLKDKKTGILLFSVLLIILLIFGASKIKMNLDTMKYFRKNSNIVKSTKYINDNFSGADTIYLNIMGQEDGDLTKPEILDFMDKFGIYMIRKHDVIGKVVGFNDMIKKMNQVMHYPDSDEYKEFISTTITYEDLFEILNSVCILTGNINPEYKDIIKEIKKKYNIEGNSFYEIPLDPDKYNINENDIIIYADQNNLNYNSLTIEEKNKVKKEILGQLVSQYLILYSGDMDEMIAVDQIKPKMAKLTITLKETNGDELASIKNDIEKYTKQYIPKGYTVEIGGTAMIINELNRIVVNGQVYSFLISILIIFIIVSISFRSISAGSIAVVPLTVSILTNFAIMGFFKLELNIATAMIASLTTGMGIDYAIHFLTFYKNNWKICHDVDKAIEMTFLTTGKAILYNAFSVGLGFAVLLLSSLVVLGVFGILITLTMLTSAFGALIFIPMLIEIFKPKFAE